MKLNRIYRFWAEVYLLAQIASNESVQQQPITKWQMLVKKLVPVHVTRLTGMLVVVFNIKRKEKHIRFSGSITRQVTSVRSHYARNGILHEDGQMHGRGAMRAGCGNV